MLWVLVLVFLVGSRGLIHGHPYKEYPPTNDANLNKNGGPGWSQHVSKTVGVMFQHFSPVQCVEVCVTSP